MNFRFLDRWSTLNKLVSALAWGVIFSINLAAGQSNVTPTSEGEIDGISFASKPSVLYVTAKELSSELGESLSENSDTGQLSLKSLQLTGLRHLFDGTGIIPLKEVGPLGAAISWDGISKTATVVYGKKSFLVKKSDKAVIVDKATQCLMAYQGNHLILRTHISSGRVGHGTPSGNFVAGPDKEVMHHSRLYNEAEMPYSVQVAGNVFIHGFTSVPDEPASHGCIRMPLTGMNPARYFYNWVDIGTPVTIKGSFDYASRETHRHRHHSYFAGRHHRSRSRIALRPRRRHRSMESLNASSPIAVTQPVSIHNAGSQDPFGN